MVDGSGVALVTGASRGVGRGIAIELARTGYRVWGTGRSILEADVPEAVRRIPCDHGDDEQTRAACARVLHEGGGRIDVLVNAAWGGYERMVEDGVFTWPLPFWKQPSWRWDATMGVGVRGALRASAFVAPSMITRGRGLIVNVSYWAARKYLGNVLYGMSKAATDKMTADMAHELSDHGVAVVALYPGLVRTEAVLAAGVFDLSNSESPEFLGRAVAALAADPGVMRRSGQTLVAAALADEYGFDDVDGNRPRPLTLEEA